MTQGSPAEDRPIDAAGPPAETALPQSRFRTALEQGEFVVTLEAVPAASPSGRGVDTIVKEAEELAAYGRVHAMSLTDNPGGGHAIMPDELAKQIQQTGLDCIVHFSCKDFTRNGAISRAYALEHMGLRNILALTGDYPKEGYWGVSKPAFDLDAVTLIKLLQDMNEGLVDADPRKGTPAPLCGFYVGACVSPFKLTEAEQMTQYYKLQRKVNAGARFVISQLGFDMRKVQELKQYCDLHDITVPLIGNVYVLMAGVARTMNRNQIPGAVVPDSLLRYVETFPKGKEGRPNVPRARRQDVRRGQRPRLPGRAPGRLRPQGRRGEGDHRARRRVPARLAGSSSRDGSTPWSPRSASSTSSRPTPPPG